MFSVVYSRQCVPRLVAQAGLPIAHWGISRLLAPLSPGSGVFLFCVGSVARALAITDETPAPPFALRAVALAPTEPVRNGLGDGIVY